MSLAILGRHHEADLVAFGRGGPLNAGEVRWAAARVAEELRNAEPGEEVVLLTRDRACFLAGFIGALEAGFGVSLPPNNQPETIRDLRQRARTVLHDGDGDKGMNLGPIVADAAGKRGAPLSIAAGPLAIHTSGSTGHPQRFEKRLETLLIEVATLLETFGELRAGRVLAIVPPHHIYGLLFGLLVPSCGGGAFDRTAPRDLAGIDEAIRNRGAQIVVSVPAHLRTLLHDRLETLAPVRRVFSSGAPLPADTASQLQARAGWVTTEVFGSTETGGVAWRERGEGKAGLWRPFSGVEVGAAEDGAMRLASPLIPGSERSPYEAADRIRIEADGRFEHLGRADGVLKVGAMRVSIQELTDRLLAIEGVQDAAVLPVEVGGSRGTETWAALVAPDLDRGAIRRALLAHFAPVVLPRRYRFVGRLPRTEHGKLPKGALRALFEDP